MKKIVYTLGLSVCMPALIFAMENELIQERDLIPNYEIIEMNRNPLSKESILQTVKKFREKSKGQSEEEILNKHVPDFIPFAEQIKSYLGDDQDKRVLLLKAQIVAAIEFDNVTISWVLNTALKALALKEKKPTLISRDIFESVENGEDYKKLFDLFSKVSPEKLQVDFVNSLLTYDIICTNGHLIKGVEKYINQLLPMRAILPLWGDGIFGLKELLINMLDEIYMVGIPSDKVISFHGEKDSKLVFALHDIYHAEQDPRRKILLEYVLNLLNQSVKNGHKITKSFIKDVTTKAVEKFKLINNFFKSAVEKMDKKELSGFFLLFHEFYFFPSEFLSKSNLSEGFEQLDNYMNDILSEQFSWFNPFEEVQTSPCGQLLSTKFEIVETFKNTLHKANPWSIRGSWNGKELRFEQPTRKEFYTFIKESKNGIQQIKISNHPQFVKVTATFGDGDMKKISFPKMNRKLNNFGSVSGVFKSAGINLEVPVLLNEDTIMNVRKNRERFQNFQNRVNKEIFKLVNASKDYFIKLEKESPLFLPSLEKLDDEINDLIKKK